MIDTSHITGLVLAGGRGARMGGMDKGLQNFHGVPLAQHALERLAPQVGTLVLNANRNLATYEALGAAHGAPVWPDGLADYAGPLAGFLTGLEHCQTPWLLTVPCDTPLFPRDLVVRLAAAATRDGSDLAMATAPQDDGAGGVRVRPQPVFSLINVRLLASLQHFTTDGGRKIQAWALAQRCSVVAFDQPGDGARAFFNTNTLAELQHLEQSA
ncbi:molybdenum cofactor guanylyltransferase MobA [Simplicispira psychrophila]|uniref:molybdenum cofactor guanylyltransferase MobA n=1 Tax=Simplicispira psychrophila TaxID=80882 RepID=UPI000488C691|nr:molybdenum cofactor guanylyltransferase MobA [Simplicispira psychrophila]